MNQSAAFSRGSGRSTFRPGPNFNTATAAIELAAVSPTRFVIPGTPFVFEFVADATGQVREVHIAGQGPAPVVMRRVPVFRPSRGSLPAVSGGYKRPQLD